MDNSAGLVVEDTMDAGDRSGRFGRMQRRVEKEAAKWGRKINAPSKRPAKLAKNVGAKAAFIQPDATTEYYKLDFAYIMKGM